jgi:membrane-bound lytic murein transglycosylase D
MRGLIRSIGVTLGVTACLLVTLPAGAADAVPQGAAIRSAPDERLFPRAPELVPRIQFWAKIFSRYGAQQIVVHDSKYVDKIYTILEVGSEDRKERAEAGNAEKKRIRAILYHLDTYRGDPAKLGTNEARIFRLYADVKDPRKFREAAGRVRWQAGLRERFSKGIRVSRRFMPEMERIFRAEGLPVELTRLPMIESCFDITAYSHKGAAGVWQFMPRTGRIFGLRIDGLIDERRDPIHAARAAARYLANAHAELGNWPLAITAYNHGPAGIARAVRAVGSDDIADLIARYQGRAFGFAGKNFYPEFLAALDIDRSPETYYGTLAYDQPIPTDDVRLPHALDLDVAARAAAASADRVAFLNPALGSAIVRGRAAVPRGYQIRLPAGTKVGFERNVAALSPRQRSRVAQSGTHRVRRGQTLSQIARRYGVSVTALKQQNGIRNANLVRSGQLIKIPKGSGGGNGFRRGTSLSYVTHRVRRGQTLSHIARRYGTSVSALKRRNGIRDSRKLRAGQRIKVPRG